MKKLLLLTLLFFTQLNDSSAQQSIRPLKSKVGNKNISNSPIIPGIKSVKPSKQTDKLAEEANTLVIPGVQYVESASKRSNKQANSNDIPEMEYIRPIKHSNEQANSRDIPGFAPTEPIKSPVSRKKQETSSTIPGIKSVKPAKNYKK